MLIQQLTYLAALARERHFGRAARGMPRLATHALGGDPATRGRARPADRPAQPAFRGPRRPRASASSSGHSASWPTATGLQGRPRIDAPRPVADAFVSARSRRRSRWSRCSPGRCCRRPPGGRHLDHVAQLTRHRARSAASSTCTSGITYLDNEPLRHVRTLPLYRERYLLLAPADGPQGAEEVVSVERRRRACRCAS